MNIRTRIIWISCLAVLAAALTSDLLLWLLSRQSFRSEAYLKALQETYTITSQIEQTFGPNWSLEMKERYLEYYFKSLKNEQSTSADESVIADTASQYSWFFGSSAHSSSVGYNICFRTAGDPSVKSQPQEIYNHTNITARELAALDYQSAQSPQQLAYAYLNHGQGRYIVFKKELTSNLIYYRIADISYVKTKMNRLTFYMGLITLVLALLTSAALFLILRREFRPLQELDDTAGQMAQGRYDRRVHIRGKDEIARLGTSFNHMAEAVEARTLSLEQSEQKKTLFMGNLTHELKTPMTAISGYAQTLLSTKLRPEQQEEALLYIYEECTRLERLSRKMMKLLELDQETSLELTPTNVDIIFEAAAKSCAAILQQKQIELIRISHGETFLMDADLMTDALINLVDNAVKASRPGQKIQLRAYDHCIEVEDEGQGIPQEEQEKILEPFYMVDKSRSRQNGGAGLGLALTALIARHHSISMSIESREGKGTKILLQFR